MIAVVMCSVELKSRHLLHATYKLFLASIASQQAGVLLQSLACIKYAANGVGHAGLSTVGKFYITISATQLDSWHELKYYMALLPLRG
jgi:hypothetical protein